MQSIKDAILGEKESSNLCWGLTTRQPLSVILCHLPEKGRREIEEIVEEMKARDRRDRKMNESVETEEIKTFLLCPYLLQGKQALPNCKPISVGHPGDISYPTSLPHPTSPFKLVKQHKHNPIGNSVKNDCLPSENVSSLKE